ncbi:MAG TPA: hypothetical protein VKS79_01945 [Gemmataceae bacterium]|nr:hypothetical protein [Gemmataceae bacterium]
MKSAPSSKPAQEGRAVATLRRNQNRSGIPLRLEELEQRLAPCTGSIHTLASDFSSVQNIALVPTTDSQSDGSGGAASTMTSLQRFSSLFLLAESAQNFGVPSGAQNFAAANQSTPGNADPIIDSTNSLNLGTTAFGTAGNSQTYTVSGFNLTGPITITAPAGVELSDNGGLSYSSSLTETPINGAVPDTTINVRITGTAAVGNLSGSITATSATAPEQDITVTGTVAAPAGPAIAISATSLNLGTTTFGTAGTVQSYTIVGSNLTGPITITAPTGVEVSSDGGATYHSSLTLAPVGGTVATTTIDVRISASAPVGALAAASITNESAGVIANSHDVDVTGTVTAAAATITVSPASLDLGSTAAGIAGTPHPFTAAGANLTGPITVTAPAETEVSSDGGATYHTSLTLTPAGGTVATTTLLLRISATAPQGFLPGQDLAVTIAGAIELEIAVSGSIFAAGTPVITTSIAALDLGTTAAGTAGTSQTYTVGGVNLTGPIALTAPAGVELSSDGGATYHDSLTLAPSAGAVANTTINARINATAAAGTIAGNITGATAGAPDKNVAVTGTVTAANAATLTVSPTSLNLGTTTFGTASTAQSYTIAGSNLTGPITITPPTGVEVSSDGGATYHSTLTLTPVAGTVAATTINARISASAPVGALAASSITNESAGVIANSHDVDVTGTVTAANGATITVSPSSLNLGTVAAGTAGTAQIYNVSGTNLTAPITITAPTGVEISTDAVTFHNSLTLTPTNGTVTSTAIIARISSSAVAGNISGNITEASTGATTQNVAVTGTVNGTTPTITVSTNSLDLGTTPAGTASLSPQGFQVGGTHLTGPVTVTAPAGVELSLTGASYHPTLTLTPDNNGLVIPTSILARISATAPAGNLTGTITAASNGATMQNVAVTGTVTAGTPAIAVTPTSLVLTATVGAAGTPQSYIVGGINLTAPITITAPSGIEVSSDGGATYHSTLSLTPTNGTVAPTTINVRISAAGAASEGVFGGTISDSSTGVTTENVTVSANVNPATTPSITLNPSSLSLVATVGSAGTPQTYTVTGSNLTAPVVITAPAGIEVSSDGGATYHSSLALTPANGTLAATTINVRITAAAATAEGVFAGSVSASSTGATTQNLLFSAAVNPATTPTIAVSPPSLDLGTTHAGTAGSMQTYTVSGSNLTAPITITAPAGVEISSDGATFHSALTLTPNNGTVASTTITTRISASASAGAITGNITDTSTGATTQNVAVTGTVNTAATPTIAVSPTSLVLVATVGAAGSPQSYTVTGSNLTAPVTVTATSGVELSSDGGATYHSTLTLNPTNGTLAATTVNVRITAAQAATTGTFAGTISDSSTGAATQTVSFDANVNPAATPTVTVSPSSLVLAATVGAAGTAQTYTVAGSNLTAPVNISAPNGIELSSDGGTTYHGSLTLTPNNGTLAATTINVRISAAGAATEGTFAGVITDSSAGATTQNVTVTANVNPAATATITVSPASLSLGTTIAGTAGSTQTFTVAGTNLSAPITITAPAGVELSKDGTTFLPTLTLAPTNGSVAMTTITARISAGATAGNISGNIASASAGATAQNVAVAGTVHGNTGATPTIILSPISLNLGTTTAGTAGSAQQYFVVGFNLTGPITITAPAGVEIASDGTTFHSTLTLTPANGMTAAIITARISTGATVGAITGNITDTSPGATGQNVAITGTVNAAANTPTITVSPTSLSLVATVGAAGAPQTYTVSGSNLTGPVIISSPGNPIEFSLDGTTYQSTLTLTPTNGTLAATMIDVRISAAGAAAEGVFAGTISDSSPGATTQTVGFRAAVNPATTPSITVSPASIQLVATAGAAGTPQTFSVSGSNLTGPVTITSPGNQVELSLDGTTYQQTLTLAPTNGTLATTTVSARISAAGAAGEGVFAGTIGVSSPGATTQNVMFSAAVNPGALPSITISPTALNLGTTMAGTAGAAQTYSVSGSNLGAPITITAPTGVELSQDGTNFSSTLTLTPTNGTVAATTITARISATATPGNIAGNITNSSVSGVVAVTQSVAVTGTVSPVIVGPSISVNPASLVLGTTTTGMAGSPQSSTVGGINLNGPITVTAPSGVELSSDNGATYHSSVMLTPTNFGVVAQATILARISAGAAAGAISGNITATSSGATEKDVAVSGTVNSGQQAGVITSPNHATFTVGMPNSFTVTTANFPTTPTIAVIGTLPPGITFHDNGDGTATLSGTPAASSAGTYQFTMNADATQLFTLTVNPAKTPCPTCGMCHRHHPACQPCGSRHHHRQHEREHHNRRHERSCGFQQPTCQTSCHQGGHHGGNGRHSHNRGCNSWSNHSRHESWGCHREMWPQ